MFDLEKLKESLINLANEYMQKTGINRSQLAEESGVTNYFLRKLFDPDCTKLEVNEIFKLTHFISGDSKLFDYFNTSPEPLKSLIKQTCHVSLKTSTDQTLYYSEDIDPVSYLIMVFASHHNGVTKGQIISLLSINCIPKFIKLLDDKKITEKNGRFFADDFKASNKVVYKMFRKFSEYYHPEQIGTSRSCIFLISESLNRKASKELSKKFQSFHLEVEQFINDPKNHGTIPYFGLGMTDCFTHELADFETYE